MARSFSLKLRLRGLVHGHRCSRVLDSGLGSGLGGRLGSILGSTWGSPLGTQFRHRPSRGPESGRQRQFGFEPGGRRFDRGFLRDWRRATGSCRQDGAIATGATPRPCRRCRANRRTNGAGVVRGRRARRGGRIASINAASAGVTGNAVPVVVSAGNSLSRADVVIAVQ